jgi:hypothetical protein
MCFCHAAFTDGWPLTTDFRPLAADDWQLATDGWYLTEIRWPGNPPEVRKAYFFHDD